MSDEARDTISQSALLSQATSANVLANAYELFRQGHDHNSVTPAKEQS